MSISSVRAVRMTSTAAGWLRTELAADLHAVEVGQAEVEQDQIGRVAAQGEGAPPRAFPPHVVAVRTQARAQRVADRLVVLHHQEPRHGTESTGDRPGRA